jgi:AAA domain
MTTAIAEKSAIRIHNEFLTEMRTKYCPEMNVWQLDAYPLAWKKRATPEELATEDTLRAASRKLDWEQRKNLPSPYKYTPPPAPATVDDVVAALRRLGHRSPSVKVEKPRVFAGRRLLSELAVQSADAVPDLVAGYLPSVGYNIMIGESGLGKSPLLVQLGICVAMGLPFLRMPTTRAKVLMVDYENHTQLDGMISTISKFLNVDREELGQWLEVLNDGDAAYVVAQAKDYGAGLILVDALRGLSSLAESKNDAASDLISQLNELKACKLVLHHPRKADRKAPPPALEADDTNLMMWMQEAAGARALINQASTRIAVDGCRQADLLLRAHYKVRGEVPRVYVSRIVDEWGEPVGYAAAEGEQLLSLNQRSWFLQVQGQTIPFAKLTELFQCNNRLAAQFVSDCQQAGIAVVTGTVKSKTDPRKVAFRGNVDVMDVMKT